MHVFAWALSAVLYGPCEPPTAVLTIVYSTNVSSRSLRYEWSCAGRHTFTEWPPALLRRDIENCYNVVWVDWRKTQGVHRTPAVIVGRRQIGVVDHACPCGLGLVQLHGIVYHHRASLMLSPPMEHCDVCWETKCRRVMLFNARRNRLLARPTLRQVLDGSFSNIPTSPVTFDVEDKYGECSHGVEHEQ